MALQNFNPIMSFYWYFEGELGGRDVGRVRSQKIWLEPCWLLKFFELYLIMAWAVLGSELNYCERVFKMGRVPIPAQVGGHLNLVSSPIQPAY